MQTTQARRKVSEVPGFRHTTAIKRLRTLRKRTKVVPGGTSAGKTYGILPVLIDRATKTPLLEISVVSESIPHLRKGALKDFLKIMKATGRYIDANYNRTLLTYTFANGSYIEFFSADQEDKVRGPRRNILYINECNNINFETYHQLAIRTSHEIWLDFNPSNEFWAYTELQDDPDTEWLTLTYKDNEALHENIVKEIEKAKIKAYYDPEGDIFDEANVKNAFWDNWWKVYGLGLLGSLEGVIFTNWRQIDSIPKEAVYVGSGLDFGFTNDPTSVVDIYEYGEYRILDERCYLTGLVNAQILPFLNKDGRTYADSAEPKSIAEINNLGYKKVYPTVKGKDSIVYGIQIMQGQKYLVTKRSTNLIKELRSYCWDKDKSGRALNKPIDAFNHAIDAVRYHEMMTISKPEAWPKFI